MSFVRVCGCLAIVVLSIFYFAAAAEHGRRVNTSKARGDQSGYLWDAERVYANRHGQSPAFLIGERNRMPLYAGYLSLFYHPGLSDPEYFEIGKTANIALSLGVLFVLGVAFARHLTAHAAANLLLVVAFGYFVYKAGYTQSELLFYGLFFFAFLACWHLCGDIAGWRAAALAAAAGSVAALAHLTKAAMLPFVVIFSGLLLLRALVGWRHRSGTTLRDLTVSAVFVVAFFAVLWPYLSTSKRVFGHYFYNVNSTFYVWYDDWVQASVGTRLHRDSVQWPDMPAGELPSAGRYWREHTLSQIGGRIGAGSRDIAVKSYQFYGYLPYLVAFTAAVAGVVGTRWPAMAALVARHRWQAAFVVVYGLVYLLAVAFYFPTSGTGTGRFFVAHLTPFFFTCSMLLASTHVRALRWRLAGRSFSIASFHAIVSVGLALDIAFHVWPRLMTTYGGF